MSKPYVYVNRKVPKEVLFLLEQDVNTIIWNHEKKVPKERLLREITEIEGFLNVSGDNIDLEILEAAPLLKVISNVGAGYDNLDLPELDKRGILATNTPDIVTNTTADITFGLLIAVARRIIEGDQLIRNGEWKGWRPSLLMGRDLHDKTLGIIGMGRIGEAVARRAQGFNMNVVYYNRNRRLDIEKSLNCSYVTKDELLNISDFVCILAPALPNKKSIIGKEELVKMRKTSILINTSRGSNVDEYFLIEALKKGWIMGAGLDVFEKEPLAEGHPLTYLDNVVLTPHIGTATEETRLKMTLKAAHNLLNVLKGKKPENLIND